MPHCDGSVEQVRPAPPPPTIRTGTSMSAVFVVIEVVIVGLSSFGVWADRTAPEPAMPILDVTMLAPRSAFRTCFLRFRSVRSSLSYLTIWSV